MSTDRSLKLGPIDQIGLTCTDLDKAQKFYCGILGLRLVGDVPDTMKFFDCDGVNIIMFKADKIAPNSCIYFRVPGVPGMIQEKVLLLKLNGAKWSPNPTSSPGIGTAAMSGSPSSATPSETCSP